MSTFRRTITTKTDHTLWATPVQGIDVSNQSIVLGKGSHAKYERKVTYSGTYHTLTVIVNNVAYHKSIKDAA